MSNDSQVLFSQLANDEAELIRTMRKLEPFMQAKLRYTAHRILQSPKYMQQADADKKKAPQQ